MQTVQLQKLSFKFFIKLLTIFRFTDNLTWKGRLFQIFVPCIFKVFGPEVAWFHPGVSRFNLYCCLTSLLFSLTLKILPKNSRFSLLHLRITQKLCNCFFLFFSLCPSCQCFGRTEGGLFLYLVDCCCRHV